MDVGLTAFSLSEQMVNLVLKIFIMTILLSRETGFRLFG